MNSTPPKNRAMIPAPGRELLQLAYPLVISFWFRATFQWVDAFYAAKLGAAEDASVAAIGLTFPFELFMIACWVGASNGLTSQLAAAMGANQGAKVEQLKKAASRIIQGLCVLFFGLAAGCYFLAEHVGLEPVTARQFQIYATIVLAGSGITSFWSILPDSVVKAHKDTKGTMWAGLMSSILNVIFNTIFVFGFGWGIAGIALSTVLGRLGGLAYAIRRAAQHERRRMGMGDQDAPGLFDAPVRAILAIALPAAISYTLMALESQAINAFLARGPNATETLAAWTIFDRTVRFLAMPLIAIGVAILPFSAHLIGKKDFASIRIALKTVMVSAFVFCVVVVTPLCLAFGPLLAAELTDGETTLELANLGMDFVPLAVAFLGPMVIIRSMFEGVQRPRPGLVVSVVKSVLLTVPMVALGIRIATELGYQPIAGAFAGSIAASLIGSVLSGVLAIRLFRTLD